MTMDQFIKYMLYELVHNRLEVGIDRKKGIRIVLSENVKWYRDFCAEWMVCRKRYKRARTIIKRRDTIKALQRILAGSSSGVYAERLGKAH